ncbi:MAG: DUF362 domain-containing protein [Verrucomicrobiaceae bacterium]|nr:MAG: DUF362 domain-containing protein [Verrucomicrobiaceae bacterium]
MFRIFFALTALLGTASLRAQTPASPAPAPQRALIYSVQDSGAIDHFDENPAITRRMTDRLILAATGQTDIAKAWRTLVSPADRVGIKLSTTGGRYLSSHRGVVGAIIDGLESAGVPRSRIVLWDRHEADLRAAGYIPERGGVAIRAIDPPRGFDKDAVLSAPVLGKLIWGDLLFRGQKSILRQTDRESDRLSSDSHLPSILTKDVTKVINVAVLSDEPGCGVAGAVYNMTLSNLDNNRRFSDPRAAFTIPELYTDARIAPKVVLHILDGLIAQYAAGPTFQANYAFAHRTLYASKDPVALDATAVRLMEGWRKESKLPPIGRRAAWLQDAEAFGAGISSEERIEIKPVSQLP